jgi:hypothetical protein
LFFLIDLFLNFILQYLVDWEFSFLFLLFTFCGVTMVSWPGSQVLWVSQIGSGFCFCPFLIDFFFQFWSFNIVLIKKLTLYFFLFLCIYLGLMIRVRQVNPSWLGTFFVCFLIHFFFNVILQHWVDWKLYFILFFFMGISWSHEQGHAIAKLPQFFLFFF